MRLRSNESRRAAPVPIYLLLSHPQTNKSSTMTPSMLTKSMSSMNTTKDDMNVRSATLRPQQSSTELVQRSNPPQELSKSQKRHSKIVMEQGTWVDYITISDLDSSTAALDVEGIESKKATKGKVFIFM